MATRPDHDFPSHSRLRELRSRAEKLGACRDPQIAQMLALLEHFPDQWGVATTLEWRLACYEARYGEEPVPLPMPPGPGVLYYPSQPPIIEIGKTTETSVPYGPRIDQDCGSIAIAGITGGGKTSLILNIIMAVLLRLKVATIVFDVKGDFTCLAAIQRPGIHVHKVREEIPLRLIQPPAGVPLDAWLARVATNLCEYRGLKKSRHVLLDRLRRLCGHFGVDQDPTKPWPSLFNALQYLSSLKGSQFGKNADYKASLTNEVQGLLEDTGKAFDTSDGIDVEQHLMTPGGVTVLQMETLPATAQQLIISLIVDRIITRRVAENVHNVPLQVLVVLDEAQLVLSKRADFESANGVAPLAIQLLRGRESGIGFIVVSHLLQEISQSVLASARTMCVVGGLSDSMSIDIAARMMNLDYKAKGVIPQLSRGQALVREIGYSDYTDAFLVDLDSPALPKDAVDEATRQAIMVPKLAGLPTSPSRPLTDYPTIMAELGMPRANHTAASASGGMPLSTEEQDLLQDCGRNRDDWMKDRLTRLKNLGSSVLLRAAQSLEARGLLLIHNVRLGRTTYTFLEVTDTGWQSLGKSRPLHYLGHGGFVHTVLISRVAAHLTNKTWANVQTEFPVGPNRHPVDVYARSPRGIPTAFEVTLSHSNVVSNALNTLSSPSAVQELIFLSPLDGDCKKVAAILQRAPSVKPFLPQIKFLRVDKFLS